VTYESPFSYYVSPSLNYRNDNESYRDNKASGSVVVKPSS